MQELCLTILSHKGCVVYPCYNPSIFNHPAAQTPLVSFALSGMGSILGPRSPFSPGWFVPFSIPTSEIPESEATLESSESARGIGWEGITRKRRRTGASPGALPSVWPPALDAPSPCSGNGLTRRTRIYEGKRGSCHSQLVASGISRWRLSRRVSWSKASLRSISWIR